MKKRTKFLLHIFLALSLFLIMTGCGKAASSSPTESRSSPTSTIGTVSPTAMPSSATDSFPSPTPSISNGQRIYNTAKSASGQPITYSGGTGMMSGQLACVDCHGQEGHGGTIHFMMGTYNVPNITWPDLTSPGMMDHPPYIEDTLKRAITQGLDPAGNSLEYPMPRWQMAESDLNDLISFIKTLK
jgi:cytochrome c oxidase subunit II